jgi:hypothetical protein
MTEPRILTKIVVIDIPGICGLYVSVLKICQLPPGYEYVLLDIAHQTRVIIAWISGLDSDFCALWRWVTRNVGLHEADDSQASSDKPDGVDKRHDDECK